MSKQLKTTYELMLESFQKNTHKQAKKAEKQSKKEGIVIFVDFKLRKRIVK